MLDCAGAAALLREWDQILVMSHASPDGDTLGSASGLLWGLKSLGKQVDFYCADPVPEKFSSLFEGLELGGFAPQHVMTVDVADKKLLGKETPQELKGRVEKLNIVGDAVKPAFVLDAVRAAYDIASTL